VKGLDRFCGPARTANRFAWLELGAGGRGKAISRSPLAEGCPTMVSRTSGYDNSESQTRYGTAGSAIMCRVVQLDIASKILGE
jgi:hypothetical protein